MDDGRVGCWSGVYGVGSGTETRAEVLAQDAWDMVKTSHPTLEGLCSQPDGPKAAKGSCIIQRTLPWSLWMAQICRELWEARAAKQGQASLSSRHGLG